MSWLLVTGHWSLVISSWFVVPGSCGLWLVACGLVISVFYLFLIASFTFSWYRKTKPVKSSRQYPVSIIIAARNEEKRITDLLNDLLIQDYPDDLIEIIVVSDRSKDNTCRVIDDFIQRTKSSKIIFLKTEDLGISGKKAALNSGISQAKGEIIITTDADCRLETGWISSLISTFNDDNIRMVFGPVTYFESKGFLNDFQSLEFAGLVASGAGAALAGQPFLCNGANLAYRKEAFIKVDGFSGNEKYISGDDVFLMHKMKKEFGRRSVIFCRDERSVVKTYAAEGFGEFIKQRIRWASKSKGYKDPLSIFTAMIVFSYSLIVLSSFIAGVFNAWFFLPAGGLLIIKMIADLPLMWGITGFFGQKKLMKWYPVFQVVYPLYITWAGVLSFFRRKAW
jgi:cellulose synthase/poly-beta-1,6-N-acetylglucosamine synthase-like glycosyltransferase